MGGCLYNLFTIVNTNNKKNLNIVFILIRQMDKAKSWYETILEVKTMGCGSFCGGMSYQNSSCGGGRSSSYGGSRGGMGGMMKGRFGKMLMKLGMMSLMNSMGMGGIGSMFGGGGGGMFGGGGGSMFGFSAMY